MFIYYRNIIYANNIFIIFYINTFKKYIEDEYPEKTILYHKDILEKCSAMDYVDVHSLDKESLEKIGIDKHFLNIWTIFDFLVMSKSTKIICDGISYFSQLAKNMQKHKCILPDYK